MCKSSKMVSGSTRVIQVSNIAPQATKDQMQTLFGYLGKIDDIRLYPTIRDVSCPVQSRICYIKYYDSATVNVAQHMTNTVFIDRALIVIPVQSGEIPDEHKALEMLNNGTLVPGLSSVEPHLPVHIVNSIEGSPPNQVIQTHDPALAAAGLPYPPIQATYDSRQLEEIRRTVLVVDVGALTHQQLIDYFSEAGEVKYLRFCDIEGDTTKYALIEMSEQESVIKVMQLSGTSCEGQVIQVYHSTQPIIKPQTKSNEAAQREIEEAMYRVKEAQNLISAAIDPVIGLLSKDKRRTRSRSRSRRRSRSRSRRRSRSRHRSKRSRSRSRHRSRRRSRSRHRHRSTRSRSRHRSSRRSRSRSRRRSARPHRSRDRDTKDKDKDKPEVKDKDKKSPTPVKEEPKEEPKPVETNGDKSEQVSKASSPAAEESKEIEVAPKKRDRSRSKDRKRDRSKSRRRSRSHSRKKRSRSRRRSRSKKRSRSRDRKRSRSRDRKRSRSRDRKRTRSRDRKKSKSRDRKRTRSRDRKRSRSGSRRSKSRSTRDSKTAHSKKADRSPNLSTIEEKDTTAIANPELLEEKTSPDNMDISNSP